MQIRGRLWPLVFQYVTWTNDKSLGGIEGCLARLRAADPNFGEQHFPWAEGPASRTQPLSHSLTAGTQAAGDGGSTWPLYAQREEDHASGVFEITVAPDWW